MKVLMIGLGGIGQRHLRNLHALLGNDLEVLAYRVRRNATVLTDKLQVESVSGLEEKYRVTVFDDLDAALAQKPAVAFVCNPSSLHVPVAMAAAEAGCHLFVEKPLSHDLQGVEALVEVVERKKLVGLVAYQMRFHPCLQAVKTLLAQEAIGRVGGGPGGGRRIPARLAPVRGLPANVRLPERPGRRRRALANP